MDSPNFGEPKQYVERDHSRFITFRFIVFGFIAFWVPATSTADV